jgi:hypothetical protein
MSAGVYIVEVGSALAGSTAARAAVGSEDLGSDRIGILPAAPLADKAKREERLAQFGIGSTPWARGGWNRGHTSIQHRGAAADPVDLAQAQSCVMDRGSTPEGPRALKAQEALKAWID